MFFREAWRNNVLFTESKDKNEDYCAGKIGNNYKFQIWCNIFIKLILVSLGFIFSMWQIMQWKLLHSISIETLSICLYTNSALLQCFISHKCSPALCSAIKIRPATQQTTTCYNHPILKSRHYLEQSFS